MAEAAPSEEIGEKSRIPNNQARSAASNPIRLPPYVKLAVAQHDGSEVDWKTKLEPQKQKFFSERKQAGVEKEAQLEEEWAQILTQINSKRMKELRNKLATYASSLSVESKELAEWPERYRFEASVTEQNRSPEALKLFDSAPHRSHDFDGMLESMADKRKWTIPFAQQQYYRWLILSACDTVGLNIAVKGGTTRLCSLNFLGKSST